MATSEFGKAFAAARKSGEKSFEFNGKKYNTRTADDDAKDKKSSYESAQRGRSDMMKALTAAERNAPAETTPLARQKIAESKRKVTEEYATADRAEGMKAYKPRNTPGARAPKQTVSTGAAKKPYMPEAPAMGYKNGGMVKSAAKATPYKMGGMVKGKC
jgi:hypothetical protein